MPHAWDRPPRVIGHRGSPHEAPENTIPSFLAALDAGAGGVELDARLTRDGRVVVHHDAALGRVVPGEGLVEDLDLARLPPEVPTLDAVLRALPERARVNVEIKADGRDAARFPRLVADVVAHAGAAERVLVTSFDAELAARYHDLTGQPVGVILPFPIVPDDVAQWTGAKHVMLAWDAALPEVVAPLRAAGHQVAVWTVNDETDALTFLDAGASSIITDRPGPIARAVASR